MKKQTFEKGDRVFDIKHGWGTVALRLNESEDPYYRLRVDFVYHRESYTEEGKSNISDAYRSLSFTEYDLINGGFSQERPINYDDYVGKWGRFWDTVYENTVIIAKLSSYRIDKNENHHYRSFRCFTVGEEEETSYTNFEPLTEEQIKILEL